MTVKLVATIQRWIGRFSDSKPLSGVKEGSRSSDIEKGKNHIWFNGGWHEDLSQPVSTAKAAQIGDDQRRLLEQILIEMTTSNQLIIAILEEIKKEI